MGRVQNAEQTLPVQASLSLAYQPNDISLGGTCEPLCLPTTHVLDSSDSELRFVQVTLTIQCKVYSIHPQRSHDVALPSSDRREPLPCLHLGVTVSATLVGMCQLGAFYSAAAADYLGSLASQSLALSMQLPAPSQFRNISKHL